MYEDISTVRNDGVMCGADRGAVRRRARGRARLSARGDVAPSCLCAP